MIDTFPVVTVDRFKPSFKFGPEYLDKRLPKVAVSPNGDSTRHHGNGEVTAGQRALLDYVVAHHGAHGPRYPRKGTIEMTRPGKGPRDGISASIIVGDQGDALLTVFSENWPELGPEPPEKHRSWVLRDGELVRSYAEDSIITNIPSANGDGEEHTDEGEEPVADDEHDVDAEDDVAPNPDLIGSKVGLRAVAAMEAVLAVGPIRPGTDHGLWRYRRGVYLPDGNEAARRRLKKLLRQRYRGPHRATVIELLELEPTFITHLQPERYINCANGLLDWRTGELLEHSPEVATTYQLAVPWRPWATCPTVDAWLTEVVDASVVPLIWEVIGTAVYARLAFHRAVMLYGEGRNGKGTLLRLIKALVGEAHVSAVTLQALGDDRFAAASLYGKVVNLAGDLAADVVMHTDTFKMLTGEDIVSAQRKYGHRFDFTNQALMIFSANRIPRAVDHTDGYHSRWVVVPFDRVRLAPDEEDKTLEPRMHAELAGVLVRAVEGLRRAMAQGCYTLPSIVAEAGAAYRRDSDPIRRFIGEALEVTGSYDDHVAKAAIYDAYRRWSARPMSMHDPYLERLFWPRMREADGRIDTGVSPDNPMGHRYGQVRIVRGVAQVRP